MRQTIKPLSCKSSLDRPLKDYECVSQCTLGCDLHPHLGTLAQNITKGWQVHKCNVFVLGFATASQKLRNFLLSALTKQSLRAPGSPSKQFRRTPCAFSKPAAMVVPPRSSTFAHSKRITKTHASTSNIMSHETLCHFISCWRAVHASKKPLAITWRVLKNWMCDHHCLKLSKKSRVSVIPL